MARKTKTSATPAAKTTLRRTFTPEQRHQILARVDREVAQGATVSQAARKAKVYSSMVYKWRRDKPPAVATTLPGVIPRRPKVKGGGGRPAQVPSFLTQREAEEAGLIDPPEEVDRVVYWERGGATKRTDAERLKEVEQERDTLRTILGEVLLERHLAKLNGGSRHG